MDRGRDTSHYVYEVLYLRIYYVRDWYEYVMHVTSDLVPLTDGGINLLYTSIRVLWLRLD